MQFCRSVLAATRRRDLLLPRHLPLSRTSSRLPRHSGKKSCLLSTNGSEKTCGNLTTVLSPANPPSQPFFSPLSPAKPQLFFVRTDQASARARVCAGAVKMRNEQIAPSASRFALAPVLCKLAAGGQQTAALSTSSTSSTTAASSSPSPSAAGSTGEESSDDGSAHLRSKLDELVNSTAVVLFMKGSPQAPQCGFSARAVAMLEAIDIADYTFINILKYPQIRALAKEHFGWPTYPLLIVGGEVVGGVDIMEELTKTGQLKRDIQKAVETHKKTQSG